MQAKPIIPGPTPDTRWVTLSRGRFALIDAADEPLVSSYRWNLNASGSGYAIAVPDRERGTPAFLMHRLIMDAPPHLTVDHINGNGLDNRRCNLRLATIAENAQNIRRNRASLTGVRGVCWEPKRKKYRAKVQLGNKIVWRRRFDTLEEAEAAVKEARRQFYTHSAENLADAA